MFYGFSCQIGDALVSRFTKQTFNNNADLSREILKTYWQFSQLFLLYVGCRCAKKERERQKEKMKED